MILYQNLKFKMKEIPRRELIDYLFVWQSLREPIKWLKERRIKALVSQLSKIVKGVK